jgi:NAD(P)-dependent dehydrogenase (short-subunit alcohol dehydrogenase family)
MKSILITGANRGIGLGIVKELISSSSKPELIFAGYRDADKSKELLDLAKQHANVIIPIQIDASDEQSVQKAKVEVEKKLGTNQGLNCLLNNAGVSKTVQLKEINEKDMLDTYKQNVMGPWRVTKAFLPLLEKAVTGERNVLQASIINISTIMSSSTLAPNMPFFAYDYQCSKAALNMYTVCLAAEMAKSNIFITLLHPGWVQTDMGGEKAPLSIEQASKNIVECITSMKNEHYGKLIDSTSGSKCTVLPF